MIDETSERIRKRFLELNVNIELPEIKWRLSDLNERFKVPIAEAERSVVSYFLREHGLKRVDYCGTPQGVASSKRIPDGAQAPSASQLLSQFDFSDRSLQDHESVC